MRVVSPTYQRYSVTECSVSVVSFVQVDRMIHLSLIGFSMIGFRIVKFIQNIIQNQTQSDTNIRERLETTVSELANPGSRSQHIIVF